MNFEATIAGRLQAYASERGGKVALRVLDRGLEPSAALTYAELDARARAFAALLQQRGARGERVLLLLPTGIEFVTGFLGALYAGAIAVPAYPPAAQRSQHLERLTGLARDAQPRFVVTSLRERERLQKLLDAVPELESAEVVVADAIDERIARPSDYRVPELSPDALAFLQYTSGSLAAPKGVMVSHANLMANERAIAHALRFSENDVMVSWLPLFHDMGLIGGLLQPLYSGASLVLMSPLRFLERPMRWLEAVSEYRGTVSGGPDFAYRMCVERIEESALTKLDLRSWRVAFSGSEPIRAATLRSFGERMRGAGFSVTALYPCYGLAEATLFVTGVTPGGGVRVADAPASNALVSCGSVPPEHTIVVVDPESLAPVPEGAQGEICVSGPSVAQGYWGNPAATDATFVQLGAERYLRTGDQGFLRDCELYISGRLKDLIIVRGRNIVPQDVEDLLAGQVSALQLGRIAAFSIETPDGEAIGVAAELSRAVARSMRAERLCESISAAVYACVEEPARLVVLLAQGQLPRTSSGKLQRSACASRLRSGALTPLAVYRDGALTAPPQPIAAVSEGT